MATLIFSQHCPSWLLMSNSQPRTVQGVGAHAPTPAPAPSDSRDRHGNLMCPHYRRKGYCTLCRGRGRGMCHLNRQRAQFKDCTPGYDGKRKTQRKRKVSPKQAILAETEAPIELRFLFLTITGPSSLPLTAPAPTDNKKRLNARAPM